MCGINGIFGIRDKEVAHEKIHAMNNCLKHRGPDDEGIFLDDQVALGQRRLSIIDLSAAGHQPMYSSDKKFVIVYNGELYNYAELRAELTNLDSYTFNTHTDTEVVLAAFMVWGPACLDKFNGMYAFAIWNLATKDLFIARDRLGIKPLYYFHADNIFAFSSEMRPLLNTGMVSKKVDEVGLVDYLRFHTVHAPRTIIQDIKMLMPGHYMYYKNQQVKLHQYWGLKENISKASEGKSYKEICTDVRELLTKAVERRLIADVPFGAFLSGGIDSSAIVGLMSKVSKEKVKTFSITFDESEFSEAKYAQLIAKKFGTDHHEIKLKPADLIDTLPEALKSMDHPSGDGINTYLVSKATKNAGITMALSGLGGDELFAGYPVYKYALKLKKRQWLNFIPAGLRRAAGGLLKIVRPSVASDKIAEMVGQKQIDVGSFYPIFRQILLDSQISKITNFKRLTPNSICLRVKDFDLNDREKWISQVSIADISTYMQNTLLRDTDQMSMANALEVRVPFIDYTLVEYVLGISDEHKEGEITKRLLVDAMGDLLPSEIVHRPKMGFVLPWKYWLKNELRQFCSDKIGALAKRKWFNETEINKLWEGFLNNDPKISWSYIWYLVILENWLQENAIEN